MNPDDTELLLVAGILAFYLLDSARLLHFDDLLVADSFRGWRVSTGSRLEMRGRFPVLPNPLAPWRTQLVASWLQMGAGACEPAEALDRFARDWRPVRIGSGIVAALVVVAIPMVLLTTRDPRWLLALLASAWFVTGVMLWFVCRRRQALGMRGWQFASLAAEVLLCPPCAPNLYRRLCRLRGFHGDPVAFAAGVMSGPARRRLLESIDARIALFALIDADSDDRVPRLREAQQRIRAQLA